MKWYPKCTTSFKLPYSSDEVVSKIQKATEKPANNMREPIFSANNKTSMTIHPRSRRNSFLPASDLKIDHINGESLVSMFMKPIKYTRISVAVYSVILVALQIGIVIMWILNEATPTFGFFVPLILIVFMLSMYTLGFYISCRRQVSNLFYDLIGNFNSKLPKIKFH